MILNSEQSYECIDFTIISIFFLGLKKLLHLKNAEQFQTSSGKKNKKISQNENVYVKPVFDMIYFVFILYL